MRLKATRIGLAIRFAYRHTWRSGKGGFLDALADGLELYGAYEEAIAVLAFSAALVLAWYIK